jgi:tetratricopeptide (TPR) repeat protein
MAVDTKCQKMNLSSQPLSYFRLGLIAFFLSVSFPVNAQELSAVGVVKVGAAVEKLMQLGREAVNAGRFDEALSAFREAIKLNEDNADAYFQMALIHFRRKDYINGIDYIKRAVDLLPDNPMLRMAYAKALIEIEQFDQAAKQYQWVIKKAKPGSKFAVQADRQLGVLLFERAEKNNNKSQLAQIGGQLILRHPKDAALLHKVGSTLAKSGLLKEAASTYIRLVKLMPANPMAELYLANVYHAMRNIDAAERHLQLALKKGPNPLIEKEVKIKLGLIRGFRLMDRGDKEFAFAGVSAGARVRAFICDC